MTQNKNSEKHITTTLSIRVDDYDKPLGRMITYLETLPGTKKSQHQFAMEAWFMPFALDTDSEENRRIALQSINRLEGQARAARELWGLSSEGFLPSIVEVSPSSISGANEEENPSVPSQEIEELRKLLDEIPQSIQRVLSEKGMEMIQAQTKISDLEKISRQITTIIEAIPD